MKILHIVRDLDIGGIQINLKNLLATPEYSNIKNYVLTLNDDRGPICKDIKNIGVEVLCCPINVIGRTILGEYRMWRFLQLILSTIKPIFRLWRVFRALDVDIVHTNYIGFLFEQMVGAKLVGKQLIWTIHGQYKFTEFEQKLIKFGIKLLGENNLIITSVSKVAMSSTVPFINFNSQSIKSQIIYNGVDLSKYSKRSLANIRKVPDIVEGKDKQIFIGSIGRLVPDKGYDILPKAAECVFSLAPNVIFLICGEGVMRVELEEKIAKMGIQDKVIFLGNVGNVSNYLQMIDIYIQPSKKEGLGIALIEAMATRLPIIASNAGGMPELLNYGEAGILFEKENPEDLARAIIRMVKDRKLRKQYSNNAFLRSENFSINKIADEYIKLYEEMMLLRSD